MTDVLKMWTIYDHPSDFPEYFVARLFKWSEPTTVLLIARDLDFLRSMLSEWGLTCIARSPEDDPVIVESWL